MMKAAEFVERLKNVEKNYKTLYVMGCFGAPMNDANKKRYATNHSYNKKATRTAMINAATSDTFGFDCVNLIKGVLWGWIGDKTKTYGGAVYASNGVKDVSADGMIALCKNVTTDFSKIEVGEAVWLKGHIGVYVGDGLVIECTPAWKNRVQVTSLFPKAGYNHHNWTKHGKLPYVDYAQPAKERTNRDYIDVLVKAGIMNSPDLWEKAMIHGTTGENCYWIIRKFAEYVEKK